MACASLAKIRFAGARPNGNPVAVMIPPITTVANGLGVVQTEMFSWAYEFANFDEPWALLNGMGMIAGRKDLSDEAQEQVKVRAARGPDAT